MLRILGAYKGNNILYKVPCLTLRDETEWVELVDEGANHLVGANKNKISNYLNNNETSCDFAKPLWRGKSGEGVVNKPNKMKKILITGVAGMIGSHLIDELLDRQDYEIIGIDNLSFGNKENIKHNLDNPNFKFYPLTFLILII